MTVGQVAVEQKMDDLFEGRVRREIVDVVATIGQAPDGALDVTELGRPNDDPLEAAIDNGWQRKSSRKKLPRMRGRPRFFGGRAPACIRAVSLSKTRFAAGVSQTG